MDALYLLSIPFVSAFNVSQIFILPLMVALMGLAWYGGTGRLDRMHLIQADYLVLFFLGCVLVSTAVNLPHLSPKNLNHVVAICAGYLIFYLGAERLTQHLSIERVLQLLFIGYLISTGFGLLEFVLVNFTSININNFVFRPAVEDYTPGFLDIVLIRARSLFEESGYFAAYMAMMAPLMAFYLWKIRTERWLRVLFVVVTLLSYFAAFSVSLFILPAVCGRGHRGVTHTSGGPDHPGCAGLVFDLGADRHRGAEFSGADGTAVSTEVRGGILPGSQREVRRHPGPRDGRRLVAGGVRPRTGVLLQPGRQARHQCLPELPP